MQTNISFPSPPAWPQENIQEFQSNSLTTFSISTTIETFIDVTTLAFVAAIILLSLLSMYFIFHLSVKSRSAPYLKSFNSIGVIRFLFVFFVFLWGLIEVIRIPFFRHKDRYPFLPSLTLDQQADFCTIYVILSLGFAEPGYFITLLFLVTASIKKKTSHGARGVLFILGLCMPLLALQILLVALYPQSFPKIIRQTSIRLSDHMGNDMVLCTNPFMSTIVFGVFGVAYSIWFLFSSWKVLSLVINKGLRHRIYCLFFTVMITLPLQMFCLGISELWKPHKVVIYSYLGFIEFLCTFTCAAVGEGILVIKPILDSLCIGRPRCLLMSRSGKHIEEGRVTLEDENLS